LTYSSMPAKSAWSSMENSISCFSPVTGSGMVVMTMLKVRCKTDVYEIDSMFSNVKSARGFLKAQTMPTERKNR
jgi:hypothetical protein